MATDLFDLVDLPSWLQVPQVDTETATRVRRWANGWLQDATGMAVWPDPVPDRLWAWGIELAGIAFRNPGASSSESVDDYSTSYGDAARRKEILAAARASFSLSSQPIGDFPDWDWSWVVSPSTTTTSFTLTN
jgi:hypothetical protein